MWLQKIYDTNFIKLVIKKAMCNFISEISLGYSFLIPFNWYLMLYTFILFSALRIANQEKTQLVGTTMQTFIKVQCTETRNG